MKTKLFALASLVFMTSCSRTENEPQENNPTNPTTKILPKKVIDGNITSTISYDDTKITNVKRSDGVTVYYSYKDNSIENIKFIKSDGTVVENDFYKYDTSGNLTEINTNDNIIKKYVKQNDGRILETTTYSNSTTNNKFLTYTNGNLIKTQSDNSISIFSYDSKNSPFTNVKGVSKISDNNGSTTNNSLEQNISNLNGNTVISTSKFRNVITYNTEGYPTEIKVYYTGTNGVENFEKTISYEY